MQKAKEIFTSKKVSFIFTLISLFLISALVLIFTPKAVKLVEGKIVFANNNQEFVLGKFIELKTEVKPKKEYKIEIVSNDMQIPEFGAMAILAQDLESDQILYQKNIHDRLPPASTTKIMTGIIGVSKFKNSDILTVYPQSSVGGSTMGLNVGEKLSFRSLLYGMMLNSGNDAAYTIAVNYPGGYDQFIKDMNKKASELGLTNTHFQNPAGFDAYNHYSSAYDLAKIAKVAVEDPQLSKIVSTKETLVSSLNNSEGDLKTHHLKNLNKLLGEPGVIGIKTGYTEKAGENFVGLVEREGHKILTVVLNSPDRFGETKRLIDWVYANYSWQIIEQ